MPSRSRRPPVSLRRALREQRLAVAVRDLLGDVAVCAKGGGAAPSTVRVDARMPAHRHGMNYRPTVAAAGDGRFAARGLMFHMPGDWELSFDVNPGGVPRETLRSPVMLP